MILDFVSAGQNAKNTLLLFQIVNIYRFHKRNLFYIIHLTGEVSERFKETVLKTVEPSRVPRVRISPSPPRLNTETKLPIGSLVSFNFCVKIYL